MDKFRYNDRVKFRNAGEHWKHGLFEKTVSGPVQEDRDENPRIYKCHRFDTGETDYYSECEGIFDLVI